MTKRKLLRFSTRSALIAIAILAVALSWLGTEFVARRNALLAIRDFEDKQCICAIPNHWRPKKKPRYYIVTGAMNVEATWKQIWNLEQPSTIFIPRRIAMTLEEINLRLMQLDKLECVLIDSEQDFVVEELISLRSNLDFYTGAIRVNEKNVSEDTSLMITTGYGP